ncbi:hypothetical protein [Roseovarius mucosus]|uniref:hypothetical protein n=1 Tax=Roseovarius mucosus TaxID=215743 RepID=UPI0035CF04C5
MKHIVTKNLGFALAVSQSSFGLLGSQEFRQFVEATTKGIYNQEGISDRTPDKGMGCGTSIALGHARKLRVSQGDCLMRVFVTLGERFD